MQSADVTMVELAALSPLDDVHTLLSSFFKFFLSFLLNQVCGLYHQCHLSFAS